MKIKISGIIVGAEYDNTFWDEEIAKGFITPESRVSAALSKASGSLDIEINSYGGSVFAAATIEAAIKQWHDANAKSPLTLTVTGIALSAAAGLVAALQDIANVRAYSGAQLMFHSCTTYTYGGPGAHQDTVTLLNNYNSGMIDNLLEVTSYDEAIIRSWFEENRAGWLTAKDAAAHGLIHEIIGAKAVPAPKPDQDDAKVMMQRGRLDLAACFASPQMSLLDLVAQASAQDAADDGEQKGDAQGEDAKTDDDAQGEDGEQEEDAKTDNDAQGEDGEAAEKEIAELKAENEVLAQQIDALKADLAAAKSKLGKLTQGFKAPQPRQSAPADWATAVKTIQDENPTWKRDSCVIEARSRYKELFASLTGRQA